MPIEITDGTIRFEAPEHGLPTLEHTLLGVWSTDEGKLVAAVWEAPGKCIPIIAGEIAYWLYEDQKHVHKSEYRYWAHRGLAGMMLRPSLCTRLRIPSDVSTVVTHLFSSLGPDGSQPIEENQLT